MFLSLAAVDIGAKFFNNKAFLTKTSDIGTLVSAIASNAIIIAGIILLFLLVLGGIGVISGAGNNNPEQTEKGKKTVSTALIGFVVVFAAYWIVQLIGKITGINILGGN